MVVKLLPLLLVFISITAQTPTVPARETIPLPLQAIAVVESHSGKDTNHKIVKSGLNRHCRAFGLFGLMPLTIQDTVRQDKNLSEYIELTSLKPQDVHTYMQSHPGLEIKVAKSIFNKLKKRYRGNMPRVYWSWLHGSAIGIFDDEIAHSDYVLKVEHAYKLLKLKDKKQKMAFVAKRVILR